MAVTLLRNTVKVAGTAAERTAYDISKITVGSTFFEWDTSDLYVLAPTGWVKKNGVVQIDGGNVELTGSSIPNDQPVPTTIVGSLAKYIPEYVWLTGGDQPTPTETFAWGYEFNTSTGVVTAYGWSGTAWVEVV